MKIGVSSYSFQRMLTDGNITHLDCIKLAKDLGFEVIEFTDLIVPDGLSEKEYAEKIAQECKIRDIQIGCYTISADLIYPHEGTKDDEIIRIQNKIDIAVTLGTKMLRHDATSGIDTNKKSYKSFDYLLPELAKRCRMITLYAKERGIKTMVENHGFFAQDSTRVEKLVSLVDNTNFGVLLDIGNFLCVDENPCDAVARLAPFAFNVHAKDFHIKSGAGVNPGEGFFRTRGGNFLRGAIIGHGQVDIVQCISILKNAGYDNTISIEFEGLEANIEALSIGYENLSHYIDMA